MPQVALDPPEVHASLITQVKYILENFDPLVARNQWGPVAFPEAKSNEESPIAMVLTPTGSFFDEVEFPLSIRNQILELLLSFSQQLSRPLVLHIETHAEHFLSASEVPGFSHTMSCLRDLNARILFGFESSNEFVRNVLYNKYLEKAKFKSAVNLAKKNGLGVGAFAFVGIAPLTDIEAIADAKATISYLNDNDISPVVMFHNVQSYTIQEVLHLFHLHKLPEPRTVLEVVNHLVTVRKDNRVAKIDPFFLADPVGGPPAPKYNIFTDKLHITCPECTSLIYDSILDLRRFRAVDKFQRTYEELQKCKCASQYATLLEKQLSDNCKLIERTEALILTTHEKSKDYIHTVRPILNEMDSYSLFEDSVPRYGGIVDEQLKAELLCQGIKIDANIHEELIKYNSYIHEGGFVHAAHFLIGHHLINTCVAESFCAQSPYTLRRVNSHFQLFKNDKIVGPCEVLKTPSWCREIIDGISIGQIIRPHSPNVVSGMPNPACMYFENDQGCTFCSLRDHQKDKPIDPEIVARAAQIAYSTNNNYQLALSGGTSNTADRSAEYFIKIAKIVSKETTMPISVEMVPPDENCFLDELHHAGVSAMIMNIEIWDQDLRRIYCPGKSRISLDRYCEAIEYAVKLFGRGQVASVFIAGLQDPTKIVDGAQKIIEMGAIPTVIPFKPFDGCQLSGLPITDSKVIVDISRQIDVLLAQAKLNPALQKGCTGCGGCSLENLLSRDNI
jgi:radical SAM protein (TIGR04043 family)/radical SAM enzyme (TIGR01210 family)